MKELAILVVVTGLLPLVIGLTRLDRTALRDSAWPRAGSILTSALAFNLTFFWQELWLVIPKVLTPGLLPVLYHNDHDWTGTSPIAELLQGTGALATLFSGLAASAILARCARCSTGWRLFWFWMAFQGLFQSLTQFAIGSLIPGNDMGRALAFLGAGWLAKNLLLGASVLAMAVAGRWLARSAPGGLAAVESVRARAFGIAMVITAVAGVLLTVPFRVPRDPIEVVIIPLVVNLIGTGWLVLGASLSRNPPLMGRASADVAGPMVALAMLLIVFQLVLRPGVTF